MRKGFLSRSFEYNTGNLVTTIVVKIFGSRTACEATTAIISSGRKDLDLLPNPQIVSDSQSALIVVRDRLCPMGGLILRLKN